MAQYNRRTRYSRDPHWITARYENTCSSRGCTNKIKKSDEVFFYPSSKALYCTSCSPAVARKAEGELYDDSMNAAFGYC